MAVARSGRYRNSKKRKRRKLKERMKAQERGAEYWYGIRPGQRRKHEHGNRNERRWELLYDEEESTNQGE